jgi:hypothetical protein
VGRACLDRQYARWGYVAMTYYNGNPYREDVTLWARDLDRQRVLPIEAGVFARSYPVTRPTPCRFDGIVDEVA